MHVLFVHRSGSGQFSHLIDRLLAEGAEVTLVTERAEHSRPGLRQIAYALDAGLAASPSLAATEYHVRTGEAVAAVLRRLRREDRPDLIIGHTGWGGLLFVKDVLPGTPLLGYCEYYYNADDSDFDFDPAFGISEAQRMRLRMRNAAQLVTLQAVDAAYTPTRWQHRQYPAAIRDRIAICHDGIDTRLCRPDPDASFTLPDGRELRRGDEVVTFVARDLDPYRGYPQFMRAAALVAQARPGVLFVVVGGDGVGYGRPRSDGRLWREVMLAETGLGERMVHIPWLAREDLIRLFQVSAAHVYLTVPFVLSWSLLEAMACGCLIVGSRTGPVQEVVSDRRNGLLAPFFDRSALAGTIAAALERQVEYEPLRQAARAAVLGRFDLEACLDRQMGLVERLVAQNDSALAQMDGLAAG
ncbi:glycosyltransferase [Bosea caraganae]|uniref:Glycosyltransferase n=2 Tax=Bosea caraganae TaxID=2763117 RepID=A0A370L1Y4_9HYPH|nr:glycosyltransferase [Bosea caraganae]RDJ22143.1 glycosyltransferase [Bosea caraganae]RDJ22770.1 glycosyltransferase [Bosea caraganae]